MGNPACPGKVDKLNSRKGILAKGIPEGRGISTDTLG